MTTYTKEHVDDVRTKLLYWIAERRKTATTEVAEALNYMWAKLQSAEFKIPKRWLQAGDDKADEALAQRKERLTYRKAAREFGNTFVELARVPHNVTGAAREEKINAAVDTASQVGARVRWPLHTLGLSVLESVMPSLCTWKGENSTVNNANPRAVFEIALQLQLETLEPVRIHLPMSDILSILPRLPYSRAETNAIRTGFIYLDKLRLDEEAEECIHVLSKNLEYYHTDTHLEPEASSRSSFGTPNLLGWPSWQDYQDKVEV